MDDLVLSPLKKIADAVNCSPRTLMRWIRQDGFPAFHKDGTWRATHEDVRQWLSDQCRKSMSSSK